MNDAKVNSGVGSISAAQSEQFNSSPVICEFICNRIPATLPDWVLAEHQGIEDRFYCRVDWQHSQLELLLRSGFDPTDCLVELLRSLGFVNVDRVEWNVGLDGEG